MTPQARSRKFLTDRGWLVGSVERRKRFPDKKSHKCPACGNQPMIEISDDLWNVFDLVAIHPSPNVSGPLFVQTTSRSNHAQRRNKILSSMESKLVLLSKARILIQSWGQSKDGRWQPNDEWITLEMYKQAPHYPNTVAGLVELRRREKNPDLPLGVEIDYSPILDCDTPF